MKNKAKKTGRYHTFMLILYADDENYIEFLNFIIDKKFKNKDYYYEGITHNRDVEDNGELKKPHDHIVLYFDNARTLTSISKELSLPPQYIEVYENKKTALLYLLHYNHGDKAQYFVDELYGELTNEIKKYVANIPLTEEDRVLNILSIIDNYSSYVSYSYFLKDICNKGLYSVFRRNSYIFIKILDKHNEKFYNFN